MGINFGKAFPSSRVIGMSVETPDDRKLGQIEDIVVDLHRGSIAYAVVSFRSHFGFGDRFFAVPWEEFSLRNDESCCHVVFNHFRRLGQLPSFKKDDWPDVAASDWTAVVDLHYQQIETRSAQSSSTDVIGKLADGATVHSVVGQREPLPAAPALSEF